MAEGKEFSLSDPTPDELREDGSGFAPRDTQSLSARLPIQPAPNVNFESQMPTPGPHGYMFLIPEKDRKDISDEPYIMESESNEQGIWFT